MIGDDIERLYHSVIKRLKHFTSAPVPFITPEHAPEGVAIIVLRLQQQWLQWNCEHGARHISPSYKFPKPFQVFFSLERDRLVPSPT